jgi:hypothetical protein
MAQRVVLVVVVDDVVGQLSFPDAVAAVVDAARVCGPAKRHVVVKHPRGRHSSSDVAAAAGEVLIGQGYEVRIVELETLIEESQWSPIERAALMASLTEQKHCAESGLAQSAAEALSAVSHKAATQLNLASKAPSAAGSLGMGSAHSPPIRSRGSSRSRSRGSSRSRGLNESSNSASPAAPHLATTLHLRALANSSSSPSAAPPVSMYGSGSSSSRPALHSLTEYDYWVITTCGLDQEAHIYKQ